MFRSSNFENRVFITPGETRRTDGTMKNVVAHNLKEIESGSYAEQCLFKNVTTVAIGGSAKHLTFEGGTGVRLASYAEHCVFKNVESVVIEGSAKHCSFEGCKRILLTSYAEKCSLSNGKTVTIQGSAKGCIVDTFDKARLKSYIKDCLFVGMRREDIEIDGSMSGENYLNQERLNPPKAESPRETTVFSVRGGGGGFSLFGGGGAGESGGPSGKGDTSAKWGSIVINQGGMSMQWPGWRFRGSKVHGTIEGVPVNGPGYLEKRAGVLYFQKEGQSAWEYWDGRRWVPEAGNVSCQVCGVAEKKISCSVCLQDLYCSMKCGQEDFEKHKAEFH